jgi:small subunit ribosomal protein S30e
MELSVGKGLRVTVRLIAFLRCVWLPTHGSLSKAGKVRSQTPKIQPTPKKSAVPRIRTKRNYEKRVVLQRKPGQNWV